MSAARRPKKTPKAKPRPQLDVGLRLIGICDAINEARSFARGISTAVSGAAAVSGDDHGLGSLVEAHIEGLDGAAELANALHEAVKAEKT
jgi:hypothetical protein